MCHFALRLIMVVLIKKRTCYVCTYQHQAHTESSIFSLLEVLKNDPSTLKLEIFCPTFAQTIWRRSLSKVWSSFCFLQDIRIEVTSRIPCIMDVTGACANNFVYALNPDLYDELIFELNLVKLKFHPKKHAIQHFIGY